MASPSLPMPGISPPRCRMAFKDFKAHFDKVEICNLTPDALEENALHKWEVTVHQGSWVRGSTAGGCRNFLGRLSTCHSLYHCQMSHPTWGRSVDQGQDPRESLKRGVSRISEMAGEGCREVAGSWIRIAQGNSLVLPLRFFSITSNRKHNS